MALTLTWAPNIGSSLVLNSISFPISGDLDFEVEFSDPSVEKFQVGGEHATFGYPRALRVIATGDILGTSAANFWANRLAFLTALTPPQTELTARRHGVLTLFDSDMSEAGYAYCRVINRSAKLEPSSPERCSYMVTFKAFVPYFVGVSSGLDLVLG